MDHNNTDCLDWGDALPNESLFQAPPPVQARRLSSGALSCTGCRKEIVDNGGQGLKASCPNCWAAIDVID